MRRAQRVSSLILLMVSSLFFQSDFFQPFRHAGRCPFHTAPGKGVAVAYHGRAGLFVLYGLDGTGKAAAPVGAEGNKCLAGEIVLLQKRVQNHRHVAPPVWIPDKDGVVGFGSFELSRNDRAGVLFLLSLGQIDKGTVVCGIRFLR